MRALLLLLPFLILACDDTTDQPAAETTDVPAPVALPPAWRAEGMRIQPVHHSSMVIEAADKVIYVDPHDGAQRFTGLAAPHLVLITDIHPDHLDTTTLRGLDLKRAHIVAPPTVVSALPADLQKIAAVMNNGDRNELAGVVIQAIPMYNRGDKGMHPKGRGNGYVINLNGKRIYISGDTEDIPEMRELKDIEVAFVCMNQPYTMTVEQAASGVLEFKPNVVFPYHYRGKDGMSDVEKFKSMVNESAPEIDVQLVDWYAE